MGIIGHDTKGVGRTPLEQSLDTKLRHTHVVGASGMGKSTFLENAIAEDMQDGYGVGVIDPKGELAENVLSLVPEHRKTDVIYFDASDFERPIGFNPFDSVSHELMPQAADGLVYALRSIFGHTWGESRMQFLILSATLPIIEDQHNSILGVQRFIADEMYRTEILNNSENPAVLWYWYGVFERYQAQQKEQNTAPIHHHLGQFAVNFITRNILGQTKDKLKLRERMDNKHIVICNLSAGKIGQVNANFIGSLLVSFFHLAAVSRADTPEADRPPFFLYIDEFHHFATDTFADILSEARSYGLGLTLAHQYFGQMTEAVQEAVLGNTSTMLAYRVGVKDAEILAEHSDLSKGAFLDLDRHEALLRMEQDGVLYSNPIRPMPPLSGNPDIAEEIRKASRARYGKPRDEIERKMRAFYDWKQMPDKSK